MDNEIATASDRVAGVKAEPAGGIGVSGCGRQVVDLRLRAAAVLFHPEPITEHVAKLLHHHPHVVLRLRMSLIMSFGRTASRIAMRYPLIQSVASVLAL